MESTRPFLGDKAYRGLSSDEAVRQYNRDLALWEQAKALEEQNKTLKEMAYQQQEQQRQQEMQQHIADVFAYGADPLSEEERLKLLADVNEFKEGSELYNKFEILLNDYNKYNYRANQANSDFFVFMLVTIVSFSWIIAIVNTKLIPYILLALIINIVAILLIKHIRVSAKHKGDVLYKKMLEMKIKHKTELETYEPDESDNENIK